MGRTVVLLLVAILVTACVMYTHVEHYLCFAPWPPSICKAHTAPWESRTKDDDVRP